MQAFLTHFYGQIVGIHVGPHSYTLPLGELMEGLREGYRVLNSPASRQMLKYSIIGSGDAMIHDNTVHNAFFFDYEIAKGWPVLGGIKNVTIANGSECGTGQGSSPYDLFINYDGKMKNWDWDWPIFLLSPLSVTTYYPQITFAHLPGSTNLQLKVIVNALPNQSVQRIYYGKMYIKKKIWFISKNINLFENQINSRASYLPLDSSPGGIMDIAESSNGKLPFDIRISKYTFTPTYSTLDIGGGSQPITFADVFKSYSPSSPPGPPKNVRAANFFTNPTEGGISNEYHGQYTKRNGTWLFQEMVGQAAFFSCSYACGVSTTSISGPNTVCNSNAIFALNNPPGGTIVWTPSSNITEVSGQGTLSYTVKRNTSGNGSIGVSFSGVCGNTNSITKSVRVGGFSSSDYPIFSTTPVCRNSHAYYNTNDLLGATNYFWTWPTNWTYYSGQGSRYLDVITPSTSGSGGVSLRVANACDAGGSPSVYITTVSSCGSYSLTMSPNPTSSVLTVEIIEEETSLERVLEDIKLLDNMGTEIKSWRGSARKAEIDVSGLKQGYYFVKVLMGSQVSTTRILIE